MTTMKPLHVSAPGYHPQEIFWNKIQIHHADLMRLKRIISSFWYCCCWWRW